MPDYDYTFTSDFTFSQRANKNWKPKVTKTEQAPRRKLTGYIRKGTDIPVSLIETVLHHTVFMALCPLVSREKCGFIVKAYNKDGAVKTVRRHIQITHRVE